MKGLAKYMLLACIASCVVPVIMLVDRRFVVVDAQKIMLCMIPVIVTLSMFIGLIINKRKVILIYMLIVLPLLAGIGLSVDGTLKEYYYSYLDDKEDYEQYVAAYKEHIYKYELDLPDTVNVFNYTTWYKSARETNYLVATNYLFEDETGEDNVLQFIDEVGENKFYYSNLYGDQSLDRTVLEISMWVERESINQTLIYAKLEANVYQLVGCLLVCVISYIFAFVFENYYKEKKKEEEENRRTYSGSIGWLKEGVERYNYPDDME